MPKSAMALRLSEPDREQLGVWLRAPSTAQQVALRCRVVLAAAQGMQDLEIAAEHGVNRHTAALWRQRVGAEGIGCVWAIAPGRGRKPRYGPAKQKAIVEATLQTKPKGLTHWSCRLMARAQGISKNTVQRLWQSHNLKPHLSRTFKLSRDPHFLEKLTDVVGLYVNPPQQAVVLAPVRTSRITPG
jgi:transposase